MSVKDIKLTEIEKEEAEVSEQTRKDFPQIVMLSENAIELLLNIVKVAADEKAVSTKSPAKYGVFILSNRMIRILKCAHDSTLKGYYEIAMGILRFAFETHLLMNYLKDKNVDSKNWLDGKTFSPSYLKANVKTSYHEVYSLLSSFAHPNLITCRSWFFESIDKEHFEFFLGRFLREKFLYTAKHLIAIEWGTIALVSPEFAVALIDKQATLDCMADWVIDYKVEMATINTLLASISKRR